MSDSINDLSPLRDVISRHDLRAKKSFGQNFLLDLNLTARIARVPGDITNAHIYEVGPGPGGLTRGLLAEGAKSVTAVEMDSRCLPALAEINEASNGRLTVIEGNALDMDEPSLMGLKPGETAHIVANLPYNVGTQLLIKWMTLESWLPWYSSLSLMFQREVADRIVAAPGSKAYGRLSVLVQWRAKAKIAVKVPAAAFTPAPKVNSAVVHIVPTEPMNPDVKLRDLEQLVARAFGQRRKMLRASLKGLDVAAIELLERAEIEPTARAEEISVEDFVRMARHYRLILDAR